MTDDSISRQAAIDEMQEYWRTLNLRRKRIPLAAEAVYMDLKGVISTLPSAQPERRWIPVKTRPMDEEEKRYWEEHYAYAFGEDYDGIMFDCPMPEDGQEVWVCSKCGNVWQDTCEVDVGIYLEDNGDWDDIVAWMPFKRPEPWKGEV